MDRPPGQRHHGPVHLPGHHRHLLLRRRHLLLPQVPAALLRPQCNDVWRRQEEAHRRDRWLEEGGKVHGTYSPHDDIKYKNQISFDNNQRLSRVSKIYSEQLSILSSNYRLFLFTPVPEVGWEVPKYYAYQVMYKNSKLKTHTHNYINYKSRTSNFMNIVKSIDSENFYLYDISELLCNKDSQRCIMNEGNELFYRDDNHLSMYAAEIAAKDFVKKFRQVLLEQEN